MLTTILVGKVLSIFIMILLGFGTFIRMTYKNNIPPGNVFWFSIAATLFIFLQWMI